MGPRATTTRQRAAAGLLAAAALAGCGGTTHFQDRPRPATPIDLSVYVGNGRVSVSPHELGAGPVTLYVTNAASGRETVRIVDPNGAAVATSGQINAGETAQINADLRTGRYQVAAGGSIPAAVLRIGAPRPDANGALLQP